MKDGFLSLKQLFGVLTQMNCLPLFCSVCRDSDATSGNERSYWAKGTGFGTGPTSSGWDVEQAMLKQKAEEEHVTCLLQVMRNAHTLFVYLFCFFCFGFSRLID